MTDAGGGQLVRVAATDDVPPGEIVEVEIDDEVILLANVEGNYYAVSAWCPHQGTSLALGSLHGSTLMCYAHLWRFDVRNGDPIWPALAKVARGYNLRAYRVHIEGSDILLSRPPGRGAAR